MTEEEAEDLLRVAFAVYQLRKWMRRRVRERRCAEEKAAREAESALTAMAAAALPRQVGGVELGGEGVSEAAIPLAEVQVELRRD